MKEKAPVKQKANLAKYTYPHDKMQDGFKKATALLMVPHFVNHFMNGSGE